MSATFASVDPRVNLSVIVAAGLIQLTVALSTSLTFPFLPDPYPLRRNPIVTSDHFTYLLLIEEWT